MDAGRCTLWDNESLLCANSRKENDTFYFCKRVFYMDKKKTR